jgi:hypothetical protein
MQNLKRAIVVQHDSQERTLVFDNGYTVQYTGQPEKVSKKPTTLAAFMKDYGKTWFADKRAGFYRIKLGGRYENFEQWFLNLLVQRCKPLTDKNIIKIEQVRMPYYDNEFRTVITGSNPPTKQMI